MRASDLGVKPDLLLEEVAEVLAREAGLRRETSIGTLPPVAAMRSTAQRTAGCTMVRGFRRASSQRSTILKRAQRWTGVEQSLAQRERAVAERVRERDDAIGEAIHAAPRARETCRAPRIATPNKALPCGASVSIGPWCRPEYQTSTNGTRTSGGPGSMRYCGGPRLISSWLWPEGRMRSR